MTESNNHIPKHWQIKKLGELCDKITKGGTPTTYGFSFVSKGINFIKVQNIQNGKVNQFSIINFITEEAHNYQKKSILEENDLLFSIAGTIGETCLIKKEYLPANTNQALAILRGYSKHILPQFLTYQLNSSISQYVKSKARGGAMNNISLEDLKEIELLLPPLPEQLAIVSRIEELLSDLENGKKQLLTAQHQLKVYRQSLLKWAFEGKLSLNCDLSDLCEEHDYKNQSTNNPVNQNHDNQNNQINHSSDNLPKGWKWVKLGDVLEKIEAGKSFKCDERTPNLNEVGVLKVSAVTWQVFNEIESKTVIEKDRINEDYVVKKDDFLFSRANTLDLIGAVVLVNSIERKLMLSDKTLRLKFKSCILKRYILFYLRSKKGRTEIQRLSTGNQESMRNIGQEKIKQIEFPLCSLNEQESIVDELEAKLTVCDKIEETISQILQQSETLKQSILKKAFEGKLVNY